MVDVVSSERSTGTLIRRLESFLAERLPAASPNAVADAAKVLAEAGRRSVGTTTAQAHVEANHAAGRLSRLRGLHK